MTEEERLRKALVGVLWLLDMCDRPPSVPGLLAEEAQAGLKEARELVGQPAPPPWSCYVGSRASS